MKFYVAVTTDDFYFRLREESPTRPVNFWRPTLRAFRALKTGEPFLFKLHSPNDYVVGGGYFSTSKLLSAATAWQEFGTRNGARSETELRARLSNLRSRHQMAEDSQFGCIILHGCFFLSDSQWIPIHQFAEWKPSIVQGKTFDSGSTGSALWNEVQKRIEPRAASTSA